MLTNFITSEVEKNEEKGRFVAEYVLSDFLRNYDYYVTSTPINCSVDLKGTVSTTNRSLDFQVEVKQRFKTDEQLKKYGNKVELRVDKYERMLSESPNGTALLYMVLLNENTAYIFNMKKLDWSRVETFNWRIKQTQVDPHSPYKYFPTYIIPTDLAIGKIDCTKYFKIWN